MKKIKITSLLIILAAYAGFAQKVVNKDASLYVTNGTIITVMSDYQNMDDGIIDNNGELRIKGDWTNDGTSDGNNQGSTGSTIFNGSTTQTINGSNTSGFNNLKIGQDVELLANINVWDSLKLTSGKLNLLSNDLIYEGTSPIVLAPLYYCIAEGSGTLNMSVGTGASTVFPVGTSSSYAPLTIKNNVASDIFHVNLFGDVLSNGTSGTTIPEIDDCVNLTWNVEPQTPATADYNVTSQWNAADEGVDFNRNQSAIGVNDGASWNGSISLLPTGVNPYSQSLNNNTNVSSFAVGDIESPMALDLSPNVTHLEVLFDTDPGFGNGTAVSFTSDSIANITFNLDISELDPGFHKAYLRTKDENGSWSLSYFQNVFVMEEVAIPDTITDIVAMEYYFDADPGFGNGVSVAVSNDSITSTTFDIDVSGLAPGFHKGYFRTKNENGGWSLSSFRNVFIMEEEAVKDTITDIVAMEYFFDADPGYGNGVAVAVNADTITSTSFIIDVSALDEGFHKAYFRSKNETGKWGHCVIQNIFKVIGGEATDSPDIVAMEYFIDTDPGFGNGIDVPLISNSIIDLTFEVDVSGVSSGEHDVYVRTKDANNSWSLIAVSTFEVSEVELTAYLEGPYNGSSMNTTLNTNGDLPLIQPFNVAPWNYQGTESVVSIPNANVVDWILLETRNADNAASATEATISSRYAAFILDDGSIVDLDGVSNFKFNTYSDTNNFVIIHHRNHLGILSSEDLDYSGASFSYDFTTTAGKAYNSGQKDLGGGAFGMTGGDVNADGDINTADKTIWQGQTGTSGYKQADLNMDGQANNQDKNDMWIDNLNSESQVPE